MSASSRAWPTVNYTFNTDVGNNGTIEETAVGGITLAPKSTNGQLKTLTLDGDPATESHASVLTQAPLQKLIDQAIEYWAQQGADENQLALLKETQVQISDLGGNELAATDAAANLVTIDDDAAGYGWSVGLGEVNPQKVDLLSALTHEFGHVLGYDHDVMDADLAVGEREMPLDDAAAANFAPATTQSHALEHVLDQAIAHLSQHDAGAELLALLTEIQEHISDRISDLGAQASAHTDAANLATNGEGLKNAMWFNLQQLVTSPDGIDVGGSDGVSQHAWTISGSRWARSIVTLQITINS